MYGIVASKEDLWKHFDEILALVRGMLEKTGSHGQTAESIMGSMLAYADSELGFNLLKFNEETGVLEGVLFAIGIRTSTETWVEVVVMAAPRVAVRIREEAFDLMASWAKGLGATKILAIVTRSPERFYEFFYKKLDFEKIGLVLERRL